MTGNFTEGRGKKKLSKQSLRGPGARQSFWGQQWRSRKPTSIAEPNRIIQHCHGIKTSRYSTVASPTETDTGKYHQRLITSTLRILWLNLFSDEGESVESELGLVSNGSSSYRRLAFLQEVTWYLGFCIPQG